eukprot:548850-Lingulodinium_polyedra.AAC.1
MASAVGNLGEENIGRAGRRPPTVGSLTPRHLGGLGEASDGRTTRVGADGRPRRRNSPSTGACGATRAPRSTQSASRRDTASGRARR